MRTALVMLIVLLLVGCKSTPKVEAVSAVAKVQLQQKLNQDYVEQHGTVQSIKLVQVLAPKYEGEATIAAYGSTFTVPILVTSDGVTTIVAAEDKKLALGFNSALNSKLSMLHGKYSDFVVSPAIFDMMPSTLKANKTDFSRRLGVIIPIEDDEDYYFGSGCAPHECTMNEAAWTIDKRTGKGSAVIVRYIPEISGLPAHQNFQLFGATLDTLPKPLATWAAREGMTEMNIVPEPHTYQASQK